MIRSFKPFVVKLRNALFFNQDNNDKIWEMENAYVKAVRIISSCNSLEHMKMVGRCIKQFKESFGKEYPVEYSFLIDEYYKKLDELSYDLRIDDNDYLYNRQIN